MLHVLTPSFPNTTLVRAECDVAREQPVLRLSLSARARKAAKGEGMSAPVLNSRIAPGSDGFRANAAHNRALRDELHARVAQAGLGGPEKNRERHIARGKLLPRERVERLPDAGSDRKRTRLNSSP